MANAWENVGWIAEEALMHLEDALVIAPLTARDKTSDFTIKPNGYAVGDTVQIKTRPDYKTRDFAADGNVIVKQSIRSSKRPMTIEKLFDISVSITAREKALNMDSFAEEVIIPAAYRLAESCDQYVATKILKAAGLYASDDLFASAADMALARKAATLQQLDPATRVALVDLDIEAKLLGADWFVRSDSRGTTGESTLTQGAIARTLGMTFFSSINFPTNSVAFSAGGFTGLTNHAAANNELIGAKLLPVDGGTGTINEGDRIMVAGMRRPLVAAAAFSSASGNVSLVDPITEIVPDNAAITVVGSGQSLTYKGLIMDQQALAVAMPLLDPASDKPSSVISNNGYSIRVVQGYDMDAKTEILSMDLLIGAEAYDPRRMTLLANY